jgi:hypothetical protein
MPKNTYQFVLQQRTKAVKMPRNRAGQFFYRHPDFCLPKQQETGYLESREVDQQEDSLHSKENI